MCRLENCWEIQATEHLGTNTNLVPSFALWSTRPWYLRRGKDWIWENFGLPFTAFSTRPGIASFEARRWTNRSCPGTNKRTLSADTFYFLQVCQTFCSQHSTSIRWSWPPCTLEINQAQSEWDLHIDAGEANGIFEEKSIYSHIKMHFSGHRWGWQNVWFGIWVPNQIYSKPNKTR